MKDFLEWAGIALSVLMLFAIFFMMMIVAYVAE